MSMVCSAIGLQRPDLNHPTGLYGERSLSTGGHQRQQIFHAIRLGAKDQNGHSSPRHVLLVFDMPIAGEEHIPSALRKRKELAVLLGPKTCLPHCLGLVAQRDEVSL
jgi:hypothetical protein